MRSLFTIALAGVLAFSGCNATVTPEVKPVEQVASKANIKAAMQDVAKSGAQGSALSTLDSDMERLKTDDAATYEAIKADVEALKAEKDSAKIKAKATEILKKVN